MADNNQFNSVEDYFNAQAEKVKNALLVIKQCILQVVPGAEERFNYNIPAYALVEGGKREQQIMIAGYKNHVGFYPHPTTMEAFKNELKGYKQGKGSVQFPLDQPLPKELIIKMIEYRFGLLTGYPEDAFEDTGLKDNVNKNTNPKVDNYLRDGCMRCKYGGTPQCKVNSWREALEALRQIVLATGLTEEIKWGVPVYTHKGKNVVMVSALKAHATISFFKGVLLADTRKILSRQGNLQSDRLVRFTDVKEIKKLAEVLKTYIQEAIAIEESGRKVAFKKNPEPLPVELQQAFKEDPLFESAFNALTPGRQRGYIIYFSQPKNEQTRLGRIKKYKQQIIKGLGLY